MKIILGLFVAILALSVYGEDEVCQDQGVKFRKCEKGNILTRLTDDGSTAKFFPGLSAVWLEFSDDKEIAPNAFSAVDLTYITITLPYARRSEGATLKILTLHPDSFAGLRNLTKLHIINANIKFEGNPLTHVPTLKVVELTFGEFTEVPEIIRSLHNLEKLSLEDNRITRIPANTFINHTHLRSLDLRGNKIETLEPGWSNGISQLKELFLMGNFIAPRLDLFAGVPNLKELYIPNAFGTHEFEKDIIRNLSQLTLLRIGYDKISSLEPGMFSDSPLLRDISFYADNLTNIPTGVFEKLPSLEELTFADNKVETIEPGAFSGLNLQFLGLHMNKIKTIKTRTFNNVRVGRLYLENNSISQLEPHAFDGLTARSLVITENRLKSIGRDDFSGLTTNDLDLSGNPLETIAPGAFRNASLKRLGLFRTPIKTENRREWGLDESVEIMK